MLAALIRNFAANIANRPVSFGRIVVYFVAMAYVIGGTRLAALGAYIRIVAQYPMFAKVPFGAAAFALFPMRFAITLPDDAIPIVFIFFSGIGHTAIAAHAQVITALEMRVIVYRLSAIITYFPVILIIAAAHDVSVQNISDNGVVITPGAGTVAIAEGAVFASVGFLATRTADGPVLFGIVIINDLIPVVAFNFAAVGGMAESARIG